MIETLQAIRDNYIAQAAFWGWFSAQFLKVLITLVKDRVWRWERFVGSGGFPSSHTSFVISTTTALLLKNGPQSDLFIVSLIFSVVVMYDASGVRLEAGRQAFILNQIIEYFKKKNIRVIMRGDKPSLKELLGHTPFEVFGGLILGILVATVQYYWVYGVL